MNINEPDEVSIFRLWFLYFIKQLKYLSIDKVNDEFENIRILLKSFGANFGTKSDSTSKKARYNRLFLV